MVTKDVKLPKIIVEGKGKVGKYSNGKTISMCNQLHEAVEGKRFDPYVWIFENVWPIIEMKRDVKSIGVGNDSHQGNQTDGEEMF
jgi:hypothetical protein